VIELGRFLILYSFEFLLDCILLGILLLAHILELVGHLPVSVQHQLALLVTSKHREMVELGEVSAHLDHNGYAGGYLYVHEVLI